MPDEIKPALTAAEWATYYRTGKLPDPWAHLLPGSAIAFTHEDVSDAQHRAAAVALDAIFETDPRKFTWERVDQLRAAANLYLDGDPTEPRTNPILADQIRETADIIAALLPPREDQPHG